MLHIKLLPFKKLLHDHQSSAKKIQSAFKLKKKKIQNILFLSSHSAQNHNCFKFFPPSTNGYKTPMPLLVYTPPRYDQIPASTSLPKIQCIQTFKLNNIRQLNFIKIDKYCEQGRFDLHAYLNCEKSKIVAVPLDVSAPIKFVKTGIIKFSIQSLPSVCFFSLFYFSLLLWLFNS